MDSLEKIYHTPKITVNNHVYLLLIFLIPGWWCSLTMAQTPAINNTSMRSSQGYLAALEMDSEELLATKTKPPFFLTPISPAARKKVKKAVSPAPASPIEVLPVTPADRDSIDATKGTHSVFVHIKWDRIPKAKAYLVYRKVHGSNDQWKLLEIVTNNNFFTDDQAEKGVIYDYKVEAINAEKDIISEKEDHGYIKLPNYQHPPEVIPTAALAPTNNAPELRWKKVPKATFYRVQLFSCTEDPNGTAEQLLLLTDTLLREHQLSYRLEDKELALACSWRIRWEDSRHYSDYTGIIPLNQKVSRKTLQDLAIEYQLLQGLYESIESDLFSKKMKALRREINNDYKPIYEREFEDLTPTPPIRREGVDQVVTYFGCKDEDGYEEQYESLIYNDICFEQPVAKVYIRIRYTKATDEIAPVWIYLNDENVPRASFSPQKTVMRGSGEVMDWSPRLYLGKLENNCYTLKFATMGQADGVMDADKFVLLTSQD